MVRNGKIANPHVLDWRLDIGDGRGLAVMGVAGGWWLAHSRDFTLSKTVYLPQTSQGEEE